MTWCQFGGNSEVGQPRPYLSRWDTYVSNMKRIFATIWLMMAPFAAAAEDCVVLLHGLARTEASFLPLQEVLELEGL